MAVQGGVHPLTVVSAALVDLEAAVKAAVGSGCGRGSRRRSEWWARGSEVERKLC